MSDTKMTLAEIEQEIRQMQETLAEALDEDLDELLEVMLEMRRNKTDAIVGYLKKLAAEELYFKDVLANARSLLARNQRQQEKTKSYFLRLMQEGVLPSKVSGDIYSIRLQKNGTPSVTLSDTVPLAEWPEEFQKVSIEANTKALVEAFKAGEPLPDGVTIVYGSHLRTGNA